MNFVLFLIGNLSHRLFLAQNATFIVFIKNPTSFKKLVGSVLFTTIIYSDTNFFPNKCYEKIHLSDHQ